MISSTRGGSPGAAPKRIRAQHAPEHGERGRMSGCLLKVELEIRARIGSLRVDEAQLASVCAKHPCRVEADPSSSRIAPQVVERDVPRRGDQRDAAARADQQGVAGVRSVADDGRSTEAKQLDERGGSHVPDRSDARRRPELGGLDLPPASERSLGSRERGFAEPAGEFLLQNSLGEVVRYERAAQPREHRMRSMTSSGSCARRTLESASSRSVRASLSRRMASRRSSRARFCFNARLSKSPACTNGEPSCGRAVGNPALALRRCRDRFSRFERDCARAFLCMRVRVAQQLGSEARYQRFGQSACVFPPEPADAGDREGGERAAVCLQSIGPRAVTSRMRKNEMSDRTGAI